MAAGETFKGLSDKPESDDSGKGNKKSNKRTTPVRAPLGLSAEMPAPKPETQAPTRLFDLITEHEHLHEQMKRHESDAENADSDKKKSKKNQKKPISEQTETTESSTTTQPETVETTETPEGNESVESDSEAPKDETEKPISEGAAEIALDDSLEEVIPLSDRAKEHIKEWNRARPQSPPTVPMSEVGQPTAAPEAEVTEVPTVETVEQVEISTAETREAEPMAVSEVAPVVAHKENMPTPVPPIFEWQPQHRAETQPSSSLPETAPVSMEAVGTEIEQPLVPTAAGSEALTPPHNPLFTQQGIDPMRAHNQAVEASTPPTTVERVVHHRPSDFWPGVFVGGAVEHIRHKRRERKMEKSQKLQQSRIAQLEYTQRRTALEQQSAANERLRVEDAARYEKPVAATEVFPMAFAAERNPEQRKVEQQQPAPKQPSPEQPVGAEEVKPLEGHHIEKSTWHKIEVDDRTGRVAEQSNIVYGEAFQRELRPEQIAAQQAQQQAEANEQEQERAAQAIVGVPTLPRPQASIDAPTPPEPSTRPVASSAPVQRNKVLRPAFAQSGADMALWGGLALVVLAIIAALTL